MELTVKQKLERLSIDPASPTTIVLQSDPDTQIGQVNNSANAFENEANAAELVDAWNALVEATKRIEK